MLNQLKADLKSAMKFKDKNWKSVLQLTIAKAQGYAKEEKTEVTDSHVIRALKSELKQTQDAYDKMVDNMSLETMGEYFDKINLMKNYLPKQLTKEEIESKVNQYIIENCINVSMRSMGAVMKAMKAELGDSADGKMLSTVVKSALTK